MLRRSHADQRIVYAIIYLCGVCNNDSLLNYFNSSVPQLLDLLCVIICIHCPSKRQYHPNFYILTSFFKAYRRLLNAIVQCYSDKIYLLKLRQILDELRVFCDAVPGSLVRSLIVNMRCINFNKPVYNSCSPRVRNTVVWPLHFALNRTIWSAASSRSKWAVTLWMPVSRHAHKIILRRDFIDALDNTSAAGHPQWSTWHKVVLHINYHKGFHDLEWIYT